MEHKIIDSDELKAKLDRGDDFKLVMVLNEWAFRAKHIPGSLNITTPETAAEFLDLDDEIVVYCSDRACVASRLAIQMMIKGGYKNVIHYSGGLADWEEAGYPMEGQLVEEG